MLYTGCHFKNYSSKKRVSISTRDPKGRETLERWLPITPEKRMIAKDFPVDQYAIEFEQILQKAKASGILEKLIERGRTEDIVLLCWETDKKDCHRGMVAAFIEKHFGLVVPEAVADSYVPPAREKSVIPPDPQGALF